jgi:acetolactate synthase small subunit
MRAERLTPSTASVFPAETPSPVACFSIQADADPSVMPRVLELFAKRGMIPLRWHADLGGRRRDELTIDLQVDGVDRSKAEQIANAIRQMVAVVNVLTSEKSYA